MLFPRTRFADRNTIIQQWRHLLSEVIEVGQAILRAKITGDWDHVADELVDVQQSADTALHIAMDRHQADSYGAYTRVAVSCAERGYYAEPEAVHEGITNKLPGAGLSRL